MNMTVNIIKATLGNAMAFSISFSSLTSINAKKTGWLTFPTCLSLGLIFVLRVFLSLDMSHTLSSILLPLLSNLRLILLLLLSVRLT